MSFRTYTPFIAIALVVFAGAAWLLQPSDDDLQAEIINNRTVNVLCNVDSDCAEFEQELKRRGSLLSCEYLTCSQSQHLCMRNFGSEECCDDDDDCNPSTGNKCAVRQSCEDHKCVVSDTKEGQWCDDGNACTTDECDGNGNCAGKALDYMIGIGCSDNDSCTTDDKCDPSGICTGSPLCMDKPCDDGVCKECRHDHECDDMNTYTEDTCDPNGVCQHTEVEESNPDNPPDDPKPCEDQAPASGLGIESDQPCEEPLPADRCANGRFNAPQCDECRDGSKQHPFWGCPEDHGGPCKDRGGDTDGDGTCDDVDPCPMMADVEPDGPNGCVPKDCEGFGGDTDGDGMCNDLDPCPFDYGWTCPGNEGAPPYEDYGDSNDQEPSGDSNEREGKNNSGTDNKGSSNNGGSGNDTDQSDDKKEAVDKKPQQESPKTETPKTDNPTTKDDTAKDTPKGPKLSDKPKITSMESREDLQVGDYSCGNGICESYETSQPCTANDCERPEQYYCPADCRPPSALPPTPLPPVTTPGSPADRLPLDTTTALPEPVRSAAGDEEALPPATQEIAPPPVLDIDAAKPYVPKPEPSAPPVGTKTATRREPPPAPVPTVPTESVAPVITPVTEPVIPPVESMPVEPMPEPTLPVADICVYNPCSGDQICEAIGASYDCLATDAFDNFEPDSGYEEAASYPDRSDTLNESADKYVDEQYEECVFVNTAEWPYAALECPSETSFFQRFWGSLLSW